jgi:hypothetical protein
MEQVFNPDDLKLCKYQYKIYHHNIKNFEIGQKVFLKSNPNVELMINYLDENNNKINCSGINFPPECILQYEYLDY